VLTAMQVPEDIAFGAVRFSLGITTTSNDINQAVTLLSRVAQTQSA